MKRIHEYNKFKAGSDKSSDFSMMLWWLIGDLTEDGVKELGEEGRRELAELTNDSVPPQELKDFCEHLMSDQEEGFQATHDKFPEFMDKYPALTRALSIYVFS